MGRKCSLVLFNSLLPTERVSPDTKSNADPLATDWNTVKFSVQIFKRFTFLPLGLSWDCCCAEL